MLLSRTFRDANGTLIVRVDEGNTTLSYLPGGYCKDHTPTVSVTLRGDQAILPGASHAIREGSIEGVCVVIDNVGAWYPGIVPEIMASAAGRMVRAGCEVAES